MKEKACGGNPVQTHPALVEYFGYCLYRSAMRMRGMFNEALAEYGLSAPMFGILKILKHSAPLSQIELGKYMDCDKASMVKFLDVLEDKGLLVRKNDLKDRRVKKILLTPKGSKMLLTLESLCTKTDSEFFTKVSAKERKFLEETIPKLLK
jgi:DNA-binding MarR family transcriptional regulator